MVLYPLGHEAALRCDIGSPVARAAIEQTFYDPVMERLGQYPPGAFVSATIERPHRGRIVLRERGTQGRVLWECEHEHRSIPEAFQCAGEEAGRTGRT
jgi:hypothetical protein